MKSPVGIRGSLAVRQTGAGSAQQNPGTQRSSPTREKHPQAKRMVFLGKLQGRERGGRVCGGNQYGRSMISVAAPCCPSHLIYGFGWGIADISGRASASVPRRCRIRQQKTKQKRINPRSVLSFEFPTHSLLSRFPHVLYSAERHASPSNDDKPPTKR